MPSKPKSKPQYTPEQEKALLVALMHKHGVPHYDLGGAVGGGALGGTTGAMAGAGGMNPSQMLSNPGQSLMAPINAVGGGMQDIGKAFTVQNNYQAGLAPTQQVDYTGVGQQGAMNAQAGYNNAQGLQAQQQALANQLGAQAQGQGPNPALAQLNQTTGQNIANQAALMASQRGSSANPGMIARQAAQQGAATQQQAAGQAATLSAQQQLAAEGALQNQQQNMVQGNLGQQGIQAGLFTGAGALTNTQNANNISNVGNMQGINAQVAQNNANATNKTTSGLLSGLASGLGGMFADGGSVAPINVPTLNGPAAEPAQQGPSQSQQTGNQLGSALKNYLGGSSSGGLTMPQLGDSAGLGGTAPSLGVAGLDSGAAAAPSLGAAAELAPLAALAKGGKVPALVSPGERYLDPKDVKDIADGKKSPIKAGEKIPGKPKVKGAKNSYDNDTVPKNLDEGGIVLPRSVTQSKDPAAAASAFVSAILAKKGMPKVK